MRLSAGCEMVLEIDQPGPISLVLMLRPSSSALQWVSEERHALSPMVTVLEQLTEDQLVQILTEPKNALIKQYAKLMAIEGVELEFSPEALRELAALAIKKGTGARALRSLLEKLMLDVMFDVPNNDDISAIEITRAVVLGDEKPLIRRKSNQAAA